MDKAEEGISASEDMSVGTSQNKMQKEKRMRGKKENRTPGNNTTIKKCHIRTMQEGEERKERKKYVK